MTAIRRPMIAGNWKMNGQTADGMALASGLVGKFEEAASAEFDMVICPPFTIVAGIGMVINGSPIKLGAQDCHVQEKGAHTGDVSAAMLADVGCRYIIVGHSERRTNHGETDELVAAKASAALSSGISAIVCIGETEAERDAGNTLDVVKTQLAGSLPEGATSENIVIAYEPVWAIGTGRTPSNDEVQEVHAFIRSELTKHIGQAESEKTRILYGGSMKPGNAKELMVLEDVDGGLIGGASLTVDDFWSIASAT